MAAIYKREMHSYLTSAVGYVFLAVFFAISGYYFFATSLVSNSTDLSYVFSNLFSIAIFLLLGAALCAIGIFISALTESQVIAAVGSLAIGMFLLFANSFTPVVSNQLLNKVMDAISFYDHYLSFTRGLIHLSDLTFFISVTVLFLFLTVRHLERRRIS